MLLKNMYSCVSDGEVILSSFSQQLFELKGIFLPPTARSTNKCALSTFLFIYSTRFTEYLL